MSTPAESLVEKWTHPEAFEAYEEARSVVAPALSSAIQEALGRIPEGSDVLEIGAGDGALRRYGGETAQALNWTESDHNPDFLALPRSRPVDQLEIRLPDMPVDPDSTDAIVGLGVLDTMSTAEVAETILNTQKALRSGGMLLHIMDMAPDLLAEIYNSAQHGKFPLPFNSGDGELGLCYIDRSKIGKQVQAADLDPSTTKVLLSLILDPERYIPMTTKTAILPHLGNLAIEKGFAAEQTPSWMKFFGSRLGTIAEACGMKPVANEYIEADGLKVRGTMPSQFRDANVVFRRFGAVGIDNRPSIHLPSFVKTTANVHVFAAEKPAEDVIS